MPPVLYTIGYEGHQLPDTLIAALRSAGIDRLVDVRDLPLSRRRGFSKKALSAALENAGVAYEHQRALGNPKPLRDLYKSGRVADGERRYRAHLTNGSSWAVDWLGETLTEVSTALLCFEQDHHVCHRNVIVDELLRRMPTLRVEHL